MLFTVKKIEDLKLFVFPKLVLLVVNINYPINNRVTIYGNSGEEYVHVDLIDIANVAGDRPEEVFSCRGITLAALDSKSPRGQCHAIA